MTTFRLSCPTRLDIKPGSHPVAITKSVSGVSRTRLLGSKAVDSSIRAEFSCSTAEAALVMEDYHATYSGAKPIELDPALFTGHEALAQALPDYLSWYFSDEPTISPVFGGRCTVSVEFQGRLEI